MNKEIKSVVDEIKNIKGVEGIYLFGSYARKKTKPFSDIDICVITDKDIQKKRREEILSCSSRKIDISIFSDLPLNVRFRIFKEGKVLYQKDELFLHRTRSNTLKSYLDFKPIIDRHYDRILDKHV